MSKFVLTAQLQLQAPRNASQVLNQTRQQLSGGVTIPVNVKNAKQAQQQITNVTKATQQASSAAQSMGKSFGLATKRFAAFTVASRAISLVTNGLANAVDEAIQFQREMVKISQVTGKSIKQLRGLQDTITSLSTGLGVVSKDLLSTTRILAQAGIQAGDLKVALDALAKTTLAPTFEDIEKTAEGAVAILSQFGEGVGALERQLGAINAVAGQFAVESGDLIGAVRRFGGVFKAAGGELEELLALFTSVRATTRESAESISTGLRTIFTRIQRPRTIEFLRQFGVELLDVEGKFVGPFEAAKRLSEALAGLGEGDITFIKIAEELGGFRQIGKVIPLMQQYEVAERARQAAIEGGNSLTKDAETAQQALAVQITKVKEEFFALIRAITETASFQVFAKTALQIASNLIAIADAIKPLIPLLTTLAAIKFAKGFGGFLSGVGASFKGKNQGGVIHQFARGGLVPGLGNRYTVPAMLSPGEFVIRKSSVQKMGASTLAAMNNNRFANGGPVFDIKDGAIGGFFTQREGKGGGKLGSRQMMSKPESHTFKLTSKPLLKRLTGGTDPVDATLKSGNLTIATPIVAQTEDNKNIRDYIQAEFAKHLPDAAISTIEGIKSANIMDIDNKIKPDYRSTKALAERQIKSDDAFLSTAAGYVWEGLITSLTGAAAEGGRGVFDFPKGSISKNRKALESVFGSLGSLIKADGKSKFDYKKILATPAGKESRGSLPDKVISDINRSRITGTTVTGGTRSDSSIEKAQKVREANIARGTKRRAAGGGIGGTDTVPALLTPGEFVVNKKAAQSIGYGNLHSMNKSGVAKYAKGGTVSVGGVPVQKFFTGGAANDIQRAQGSILQNVEQAGEVFKSMMEQVAPEIKAKILETFQGFEDIQAGSAGTKAGLHNEFGEGTRGRAARGTTGETSIGLQIQGAKVAATEETVMHETGHIADMALGKQAGSKGLASKQEGTFQFDLMEKIKPEMEAAFTSAGMSAERIQKYLNSNEELFAEFFAKASPEVRKILTSTTDSAKGMAELKGHLEVAGATYAGLEASDIEVAAPQKPLTNRGAQTELSVGGGDKLQKEIQASATSIAKLRSEADELSEAKRKSGSIISKLDAQIQKTLESSMSWEEKNRKTAELGEMRLKVDQERQQISEQLAEVERKLVEAEKKKVDQIEQARGMKETSTSGLTTGTQSTVTEAIKSQGQTQKNIKDTQTAAAAAAAHKVAVAKMKADQKSILSLEQLAGATFGVTTALSFLRPTVDENSSALEKGLATTVDGLMKLTSIVGVVAGALQVFGVKLSKQNFSDLGSFLTGGKIGGARGAKRVQQRFRVGAKKVGRSMQNIPGLGKFGKYISKIAPQLGKFAAGLGPIIAGFAAAVGGIAIFTNLLDRFTGVHKKAEEAIEKGNRAEAGQLAVNSRVQKDFNNLAMAAAGVGAMFGPVGAAVGFAVGAIIKLVGQTEAGQKAMKAFRDNVLVMFGGDSTKTIEAQANLQASVNKLKLEEADNTKKAAEAMKAVEKGSRTLADAWASGDLTGNLENQLAVFTDTVALEASKMADLEKMYQGGTGSAIAGGLIGGALGGMGGAAAGAALGSQVGVGGILKEMGALVGLTTSYEEDRKASEEAFKKANKEFTTQFKENGEVFSKVSRSIIGANPGASLEEVRATLLRTNPAIAAAVEGMGSDERRKYLDQTIEGSIKAYEKQMKYIESLNFGMQKFADRLAGTTALMSSTSTLGESGGTSFDRSAEVLNVALSGAAKTLSDGELEGAVNDMRQSLRDAGASSEEIEKTVSRFKGLNEINKRLDESSPAFKKFQQDLRDAQVGGAGDLSPDAVLKSFADSMTEGLDEEAAKQVRDSIESMNLDQKATDQILAGDLTPLYDALGEAGEEFKKQIVDGIVKQRGAAEKELINSIKKRKASEDEFIAAQRKAIDIQLEAAKVFEDFGGRALTGQEKLSARVAQFNVGAGAAGITGLGSGSASDIQRVAGEISGNFNTLQSQATAGVVAGKGAFDNREGAERDNRERLKKANDDLLNFTKQRIGLLKEELAIVQKKNQEEKNALEKLLSGDIEGFLQGQAAAGAGAALRTGDAGLAGLFGASALGAGFKSLEGQGLGDPAMERAAGLSLGAVGVTDTRSAQILAGTTAEEEAIKSEGRELAGVMGDLAQQSAQFEKAEITTQEAIINAQELRLENLTAAANQAQGFARGGPVYANRGMFVPRGTDTVPAMLTPGEFVVNRSAVQRGNNLQLLRAMNSGGGASGPSNMSGGGQVRYYNLGGIVESIGSAFSDALPNLQNVFSNFAASVDKLVNTKFNVALDTTNVNVNFNGASFLETLKEDIKNELLEEVSEQIKKAKPSTSGDMETRSTVLGN